MTRRVVVHSSEHASAAVDAAATLNVPVTLASAPAAGCYGGTAWFKSIVDQAVARHPETQVDAIVDCGDEPGTALAALRVGLKRVRCAGTPAALDRLRAIAAAHRATIEDDTPGAALDLLDARDAARACRDFLTRP